jgi:hypothetical protein
MPSAPANWKASFGSWIETTADEFILRWLLRIMIIATVTVVALDYTALDARLAERAAPLPTTIDTPPAKPLPQTKRAPGPGYLPQIRVPNAKLREKMSFELQGNGRLIAMGAITPGVATAFAEEVEKRGTYIKTVVLNSPGGSVQDALAMGRLIRDKGFSTEVENSGYCASSCPLMFAGGVQRLAGKSAAIGVHQVFSIGNTSDDSMASAQQISALCQKHLRDLGVDLGVWVHAMETPKEELYYFKSDELLALKLATSITARGTANGKA